MGHKELLTDLIEELKTEELPFYERTAIRNWWFWHSGRQPGQRVKADRHAPKVLQLVGAGQSYREISHRLGISKNTVLDIVKRSRTEGRRAA